MKDGGISYIMTYHRINAVTLQGLTDVAAEAGRRGTAVFAASPLLMGLLGSDYQRMLTKPPTYLPPCFVDRAKRVKALADDLAVGLSQLSIRFLLSMPAVAVVVCGPTRPRQWEDCRQAYDAGPLPADVYQRIWQIAQQGTETFSGH